MQLVLSTRPNSQSMNRKLMLPRDLEGNMEFRQIGRTRSVELASIWGHDEREAFCDMLNWHWAMWVHYIL